jgi:hypothetical protein
MPRLRDMVHGRCGQVTSWSQDEPGVRVRLAPKYCPCPGFASEDSLGLGAVCVHCGHLRVQHNRRAEASSTPEEKQ